MRHRHSGRAGVMNATTCTGLPALAAPAGAPRSPTSASALGQLDLELTAIELVAVEARDRLVGLLGRRHLDEAEPARAAGVPIDDDRGGFYSAGLGKEFPETLRGCGERETADEELVCHCVSPRGSPAVRASPLERGRERQERV